MIENFKIKTVSPCWLEAKLTEKHLDFLWKCIDNRKKEAIKNKIALPETYSGYSQHSYETHNLANDHLKASEILEFRDYSWDTYHSHPGYLSLMRYKFGQKAVDELVNLGVKRLKISGFENVI